MPAIAPSFPQDAQPVNNSTRELVRAAASVAIVMVVVGCATRPTPDFWGRWRPVNRYAEQPQPIALQQEYLFYASPLDGTLKSMLSRWTRDARMTLSYLHPSDFTLHSAVAGIRTSDLGSATTQLSQAYAAQQVAVVVEGNQIVVRPISSQTAASSEDRGRVDGNGSLRSGDSAGH